MDDHSKFTLFKDEYFTRGKNIEPALIEPTNIIQCIRVPPEYSLDLNKASEANENESIELQGSLNLNTCMFRDGTRTIDVVLVVKDSGILNVDKIKTDYLTNVVKTGLQIEVEPGLMSRHKELFFVKIHAPDAVLEEYGNIFGVKSHFKNSRIDYITPKRMLIENIFAFTKIEHEKAWIKLVRKRYQEPLLYSTAERSLIVYKILLLVPFGDHQNYIGLNRLLKKRIVLDAYTLHDGPYFFLKDQEMSRANARQILFYNWVGLRNFFKVQPLDLIHEYFGPRVITFDVNLRYQARVFLLGSRRPLLLRRSGLGSWTTVFMFVSFLAIISNAFTIMRDTRTVSRLYYFNKFGNMTGYLNYTLTPFATKYYTKFEQYKTEIKEYKYKVPDICYFPSLLMNGVKVKKEEKTIYKSHWYYYNRDFSLPAEFSEPRFFETLFIYTYEVLNSTTMGQDCINIGDYIVIKKQNYQKLHKYNKSDATVTIGKFTVHLGGIQKCPYYSVFRMLPNGTNKNRNYILELTNETVDIKEEIVVKSWGTDNRNILDDGRSQKLTAEEIDVLKTDSSRASKIVETLITNSNTFHNRSEFSQEKYLRKKEKKYFEYIQILRPNLRLIAEILFKLDPSKVQNMRIDTLSQIISLANISAEGNHLLYDSGSSGLLAAALLSAIGTNTIGKLIHMHPGNMSQKQALLGMNFDTEQYERCVSVNVYSALRQFYQGCDVHQNNTVSESNGTDISALKRKACEVSQEAKVQKLENSEDMSSESKPVDLKQNEDSVPKKPKWHYDNILASELLSQKVDSLVIACKEDPENIFNELSTFVKPGRPFVVFFSVVEPLQNLFMALKAKPNVGSLRLTCNWLRNYQVLPDRTHPEVTMSGSSGFLLTGYILK